MIDLDGATPLGEGCRRVVYEHPRDAAKCIKIITERARGKANRQKAFARERHYLKLYQRRGRDMSRLSQYFGLVDTSRGPGDVFGLVRDVGGAVSITFQQALADSLCALADCEGELENLRSYLRREGILIADLHAANLAWRRLDQGRTELVVIDGVGNNDYIKIADWFRPWARRKLERRWAVFRRELEEEFGSKGS